MIPFIVESWLWWTIVWVIAISRYVSRHHSLGSWRNFQRDEYVMAVALCFYTAMVATINIVEHTNSNLLPRGFDISTISPSDKAERVYGSKLILVVEECQIQAVWLAKACLLITYSRLTSMRRQNVAVKALMVYVALGWLVMEVLYLGVWCRPFHEYWAVPTNSVQCSAATNHLITNAVLNISSDVLMLMVALPMFLRLNLKASKKIPIAGIFSLGVFVIVASILNKVHSFMDPFGVAWVYWYVRESSTALIVTNLPFVWYLYRKIFRIKSLTGANTTMHSTVVTRVRRPNTTTENGLEKGLYRVADSDPEISLGTGMNYNSGSTALAEALYCDPDYMPAEGVITPFTHPALFYGRNGAILPKPMDAAMTRTRTGDIQPTVRRSTSVDTTNIPESSGSSCSNPLQTHISFV